MNEERFSVYFIFLAVVLVRECPGDAPTKFMYQDMLWELESRRLGTVATYTCPLYLATEDYHTGKKGTIHFYESDLRVWLILIPMSAKNKVINSVMKNK